MKTTPSRKEIWPRKIRLGRVSVSVFSRQTPGGNQAFMVANYANGKRRFDSYATEADALDGRCEPAGAAIERARRAGREHDTRRTRFNRPPPFKPCSR